MQLVGFANALKAGTLVTLKASIGGVGGDWATETYPVSLGWGVTLSAPGVYFTDTHGKPEIFDVALATGETAGHPVVIGVPSANANDQVVIGVDSSGNLTTDAISVLVEKGQTLDMLNAQVLEAPLTQVMCNPWCGIGVDVQDTATLNVGSDNSSNSGTVYFGGALPNGTYPLYANRPSPKTPAVAIYCNGTVTDAPGGATPSMVSTIKHISIDAEDSCTVTLNNDPTFGEPTTGGYNGCTMKSLDDTAILANGNAANVTLSGATISCMNIDGIDVTNTNAGANAPVVTVQADDGGNPSVIENCQRDGIYVTAGSVYVIGSTIEYNYVGIDMETDTTAAGGTATTNPDGVWINDGTGNAQTANSSVICNSSQEIGGGGGGIDVWNNSTAKVNADYVNWDQWYDPDGGATGNTTDIFYCDDSFTCTCEVLNSACVNTTGDDMDLVMGTGSGTTPTGTYSIANGASSGSGCQ
jgi:hypothetical protein